MIVKRPPRCAWHAPAMHVCLVLHKTGNEAQISMACYGK